MKGNTGNMELKLFFALGVLLLFVFGVGYSEVDWCITKCCGEYGGAIVELEDGNIGTCNSQPGCMIVYAGSVKGRYDEACVAYASSTNYNKDSIVDCIGVCMNSGPKPDYGPSPFNTGETYVPPEEEEPPTGPCANIHCSSTCEMEGGKPVLYHSGKCFEDNQTEEGYTCGYVKGECVWECNSAGDGCNDYDPLQLSIEKPEEGQKFDTGKKGFSEISVSGTVMLNSEYPVSRVMITSTIASPKRANFDSSSGKFSLDMRIPGGRPVQITATAFDSSGRRLATKRVKIYPSPKMMMLSFSKKSVTLYRNGQIISSDYTEGTNSYEAMEGDEFEISGDGEAYAEYSDGTLVIIKAPCKLKFYKKGIYLLKGAIEVNVKHDFTVLGKLGYTMVKGTRFKVIVPENEKEPESLIVLEGRVATALQKAPETEAFVNAGEHLYFYPGIIPTDESVGSATTEEKQSFEKGGKVTSPEVSGETPNGWKPEQGGCCATAFILMGLMGAIKFSRR